MDTYQEFGIKAFCHRAKILLNEKKYKEFIQFVLCGIDNHTQGQVMVNAFQNCIEDDESLEVMRDYDSVLGIDPDIKVLSDIDIFPLARHADTLTSNVHLSYRFEIGDEVRMYISFTW